MLRYAGRAHAQILDTIEGLLPEQDDCMPIDALKREIEATEAQRPAPALGAYFPGWHGVTELGW